MRKNFALIFFVVRGQPRKFNTGHQVHYNKDVTRKMDECEWALCIREYHVFREIWEAAVGEVLACEKQPRNAEDGYAVVVKWTELSLRIASCTSQFA